MTSDLSVLYMLVFGLLCSIFKIFESAFDLSDYFAALVKDTVVFIFKGALYQKQYLASFNTNA